MYDSLLSSLMGLLRSTGSAKVVFITSFSDSYQEVLHGILALSY